MEGAEERDGGGPRFVGGVRKGGWSVTRARTHHARARVEGGGRGRRGAPFGRRAAERDGGHAGRGTVSIKMIWRVYED